MARLSKAADRMTKHSRSARASRKKAKAPKAVFGTSSQFKGIGRGVPGDPRK